LLVESGETEVGQTGLSRFAELSAGPVKQLTKRTGRQGRWQIPPTATAMHSFFSSCCKKTLEFLLFT